MPFKTKIMFPLFALTRFWAKTQGTVSKIYKILLIAASDPHDTNHDTNSLPNTKKHLISCILSNDNGNFLKIPKPTNLFS
jgi:hypothetical protein